MKKPLKIQILAIMIILATIVFCACAQPSVISGGSTVPNAAPSAAAKPTAAASPSPSPSPSPDPPQKVFVSGAKSILSKDYTKLLTDKEDGASLLGLTSDFITDLSSSSNNTTVSVTAGSSTEGKAASTDSINIGLDIKHSAQTGDTSIEFSGGEGTDTNIAFGAYIKDSVALLKGTGTNSKIYKYLLPEHSDKSIAGNFEAMVSGILTGKASSPADQLKGLQEFASRFFDPWMTSTKPEDFTDTKETRTLLGKDKECRVVSLNMSGQAAYDFALGNLQTLDGDSQFTDINTLFGFSLYFMSHDLKDISSDMSKLTDDIKDIDLDSLIATKQLIGELKALTADEIAAAKYKVSVVFADDQAVGLDVAATTGAKAFKLSLLAYRKGLEHQVSLSFQDISGASITVDMSKVKSGDNTYSVSASMKGGNAKGSTALSGDYTGTVAETSSKQDTTAAATLNFKLLDADDQPIKYALNLDVTNSLSKTDSGYSGTGTINMKVSDGETEASGTIGMKVTMTKTEDIAVTPPLYTAKNVEQIDDLQTLIKNNGGDYSKVENLGTVVKLLYMFSLLTDK